MKADHPVGGSNAVGPTDGAPVKRPFAPRRSWLAFLLAFVAPGLGHLYAGVPLRGVLAFALWVVVMFGTALLARILAVTLGSPASALLGAAVVLPILLSVHIDATYCAWRRSRAPRTRWQRWWWYSAWILAWALSVETSAFRTGAMWFVSHVDRPFRFAKIPGAAMSPTLLEGDYVVLDSRAERARACERGDLVVFKYPPAPETEYLKRVVGLPGDTVAIRRGRLHVNDEPVTAPLGDGESVSAVESFGSRRYRVVVHTREVVPRIVVPEGTVFVMGDNRVASADSRIYGPVPLENVVAIPLGVVASRDATGAEGIRWKRFGLRL